jgi:putative thioredoxin
VLAADPANGEAQVLLARLLLFEDPGRAAELARAGQATHPDSYALAQAITTIAPLLSDVIPSLSEESSPNTQTPQTARPNQAPTNDTLPNDPARAPYLEAIDALRRPVLRSTLSRVEGPSKDDIDTALDRLIHSVRLNRRYQDDAARRTALALFAILGPQHELTRKHQRPLEMALF